MTRADAGARGERAKRAQGARRAGEGRAARLFRPCRDEMTLNRARRVPVRNANKPLREKEMDVRGTAECFVPWW